jgi:hypothetical protein
VTNKLVQVHRSALTDHCEFATRAVLDGAPEWGAAAVSVYICQYMAWGVIRARQRRTQLATKQVLATQFAPQRSQAEQTATEQRNCRAAIGNASPSNDEREVLIR